MKWFRRFGGDLLCPWRQRRQSATRGEGCFDSPLPLRTPTPQRPIRGTAVPLLDVPPGVGGELRNFLLRGMARRRFFHPWKPVLLLDRAGDLVPPPGVLLSLAGASGRDRAPSCAAAADLVVTESGFAAPMRAGGVETWRPSDERSLYQRPQCKPSARKGHRVGPDEKQDCPATYPQRGQLVSREGSLCQKPQ